MIPPQSPQDGNPDAQLDRLLAHLGQAEPSPDLPRRLLQRLENHPGSTPADNRLRPRLRMGAAIFSPLGLIGTAAAVLVALALSAAHRPSHPHKPATSALVAVKPSQTPALQRVDAAPFLPPRSFSHPPRALSAPKAHERSIPSNAASTSSPKPSPEEAQALDDFHAPSQPAPPMPLTTQERAILRLLRRDRTVDLAELDPALRADRDRADQLARSLFFDPPLPPQPQGESK